MHVLPSPQRSRAASAIAAVLAACLAAAWLAPAQAEANRSGGSSPARVVEDLAYGPATPGNLLDLHLPATRGTARLPLVIWHSGSAWFSNSVKQGAGAQQVVGRVHRTRLRGREHQRALER